MSENISKIGIAAQDVVHDSSSKKKPFDEPKLTFIEPELVRHGDASKITKVEPGFFGTFVP